MAKGAPDFTKMVALYGTDGTDLVLVKLDSDGQLYALLMGDASGTPTAVKVNTDGELYAVLKAAFGGTLKDVAADTNGNLTLNLKAQDLAEVINRPKYGAAGTAEATEVNCPAGDNTTLTSVSGQGLTYGGQVWIEEAVDSYDFLTVRIDGEIVDQIYIDGAFIEGRLQPTLGMMWTSQYDTITPRYQIILPYGLTFETSLSVVLRAWNTDREANARITYALV